LDIKALLTALSEAPGPSGYEAPIRAVIEEYWRPLTTRLEVGRLGSLVGLKEGTQQPSSDQPRRRIALYAHMDEVAYLVHHIDDGGFIFVQRLGYPDPRVAVGKNVLVHGKQVLRGVFGAPPLHTVPKDKQEHYPTFQDLYVDVAMPVEEVRANVKVGDIITFDVPVMDLGGGKVTGKSFDDRALVSVVTVCLDMLQKRHHHWDVLAIASTQEEVGLHGARSEAYRLQTDLAIALDVTFAPQPGVADGAFSMGTIPLSLGANFHPALHAAIDEAAGRLEMTLPRDPLPADSGTDGWAVQVARDGTPTALLSIPIRNMHTTAETLDLKDIERLARLLTEFICGLTEDFMAEVVWEKEAE
jgi:tetrahedral aminopeptidase